MASVASASKNTCVAARAVLMAGAHAHTLTRINVRCFHGDVTTCKGACALKDTLISHTYNQNNGLWNFSHVLSSILHAIVK